MNHPETVKLLALMAAMDRRTIGDAEVLAWQSVLDDVDYEDAAEAVRRHYRDSDDYLMPVHVRRGAQEIADKRGRKASSTPWAPGQHGVLKEDAMPEVSGPVDENALTPPVRALLDSVRAMLPEGSREALMPRRVAWEREHRAYTRVRDGEPNPLYRPQPDDPATLEKIRQVCQSPNPDCRSDHPCQAEGPHWWSALRPDQRRGLDPTSSCRTPGHRHIPGERWLRSCTEATVDEAVAEVDGTLG